MTVLVEIQKTDSDLARPQLHRRSVALPDPLEADEDPCSRMRYHQRSCSIGFLGVAWAEGPLVVNHCFDFAMLRIF